MSLEATQPLRLLFILAHPDDESIGPGGVLARYAAEGVDTYLVTATRGEMGWFGAAEENPGPEVLGQIRERELNDAAKVLGLREVTLLDYRDGELHKADQSVLTKELVAHIRRIAPHVVLTFDQAGIYGHPDHMALTRAATSAVFAAADPDFEDADGTPRHAVSKLYYFALTDDVRQAFEAAFGELVMNVDGVERRPVTWPQWAVTTRIDAMAHWRTVWEAIGCHRSQLPGYQKLLDLPEDYHRTLWGQVNLYRVFSLAPATEPETDMFDGLRGTK